MALSPNHIREHYKKNTRSRLSQTDHSAVNKRRYDNHQSHPSPNERDKQGNDPADSELDESTRSQRLNQSLLAAVETENWQLAEKLHKKGATLSVLSQEQVEDLRSYEQTREPPQLEAHQRSVNDTLLTNQANLASASQDSADKKHQHNQTMQHYYDEMNPNPK